MRLFDKKDYSFQPEDVWGRIELKTAIKIGLAGSLGWLLGIWFSHLTERPDSLVSGTWCALTAIVVLQTNLGGTYQAALLRFLGIIIGSFMGGLGTSLLGSHSLSLGISIIGTVIICSAFNMKDSVRIACMSVAIVMILWGLNPAISPWSFAFFRVIDSIFGILIALGIAHFIWPFQAARKLRLNVAHILFRLSQLLRLINDFGENKKDKESKEELWNNIKEIEVLMQKDISYLEEAKLELLMQPERLELWALVHDGLESLFKLILSLRRTHTKLGKIADTTLIEQVNQTYDALDKSLQHMAHQLTLRQPVGNLEELNKALEDLEEHLEQFRNSHSTRTFKLPDVESFFVFFYSMKRGVVETQKIANNIDVLYGESPSLPVNVPS